MMANTVATVARVGRRGGNRNGNLNIVETGFKPVSPIEDETSDIVEGLKPVSSVGGETTLFSETISFVAALTGLFAMTISFITASFSIILFALSISTELIFPLRANDYSPLQSLVPGFRINDFLSARLLAEKIYFPE